jgi:RND family efflux transporter MFP subunit
MNLPTKFTQKPATYLLSLKTSVCALSLLATLSGLTGAQPAAQAPQAGQTPPVANTPGGPPAGGAAGGGGAPGAGAPGAGTPGAAGPTGAPPAPSGPPVSITSVRAQLKDLPIFLQATGAVTPVSSIDIRSQVTSVITQVHVKEGQFVRKGDPLFTLDTRADDANVAKAKAQLARDQATLSDVQRQLVRNKQLLEKNFISQGALDSVQAQVEAQTALLAADKAALDAARVPLSYGKITAPNSGRIGTISVFTGSSVQANQTSLVTITQLDPIAVQFNLPQRYLSNVLGMLKEGGAQVEAKLPESKEAVKGKLTFVDTSVDGNTGTVKAKATFGNKENALWPGSFVNVSVQGESLKDAVVIPLATIVQTARGSIVFVIDKENKASIRPVQVVQSQGDDAAVTGLRPGEKIALEGRQNLRPGSIAIERARDPNSKGGPGGPGGPRPGSGGPGGAGAGEKGGDKGGDKGGEKGSGQGKPPEKSSEKSSEKPAEKPAEKSAEKAKP